MYIVIYVSNSVFSCGQFCVKVGDKKIVPVIVRDMVRYEAIYFVRINGPVPGLIKELGSLGARRDGCTVWAISPENIHTLAAAIRGMIKLSGSDVAASGVVKAPKTIEKSIVVHI